MPPLSPAPDATAPLRRLFPGLRYPIPVSEDKGTGTLAPRAYEYAGTVPQGYGNAPFGPSPGAVAGIVLGSVAGFVLLLALVYWIAHMGSRGGTRVVKEMSVRAATESVVSWNSRPRAVRKHRRRSKSSKRAGGRREKVEIRRSRTAPVRIEREDEIVVEEYQPTRRTRTRSRSRRRSATRVPPPPPPMDSVLSSVDDRIIVEEDHHSPPRRRESMRSQRRPPLSDDNGSSIIEDTYVRATSRRRSRSRA